MVMVMMMIMVMVMMMIMVMTMKMISEHPTTRGTHTVPGNALIMVVAGGQRWR